MTVLEKYIIDHPTALSSIENGLLPIGCPSNYGYAFDPAWCDFETRDCRRCWNREIPGTEKENEKMSDELIEKAYNEKYGSTSASSHMYDVSERTCDLDYKAEYERLKAENESLKELLKQKDDAIEYNKNRLQGLRQERNMYRYGLHVVEAFLGRDILEED